MKINCATLLSVCFGATICSAQIAVPKPEIIGHPAESLQSWMFAPNEATYPDSIRLDLKNGKIVGLVCNYPEKAAKYSSVKDELQTLFGVEPRITDGAHTIWRLDEKQCGVTLTTFGKEKEGLTIIMNGFFSTKPPAPASEK